MSNQLKKAHEEYLRIQVQKRVLFPNQNFLKIMQNSKFEQLTPEIFIPKLQNILPILGKRPHSQKNLALVGQAVSEKKIFEIVDGRTPDHGHPISSPCEPNGSGELNTRTKTWAMRVNNSQIIQDLNQVGQLNFYRSNSFSVQFYSNRSFRPRAISASSHFCPGLFRPTLVCCFGLTFLPAL